MNPEQIKNKYRLKKFLRRTFKPVNYLLAFLIALMVFFFTVKTCMQKMGIPQKGDIHRAVEKNQEGRVFVWLAMRPELCRERNRNKLTPLHTAARFNRRNCAVWLIFWGASTEASDPLGQKPLHTAVYYGNLSMVRLLVRKGADVNSRDFAGKTPLGTAILWNKKEIADYLRQYGAQGP